MQDYTITPARKGLHGHRPKSVAERFWSKVATTDGCWLWVGAVDQHGYGRIGAGGKHGRALLASRVSYALHFGPFDETLFVLHHCDTPRCVRPDHLFLGTQADNIADMHKKGRAAVGDRHGLRLRPDRIPRGTKHPAAQITEVTAKQIKTLRQQGVKIRDIATRLNVTISIVQHISDGSTWQHLS